MRYSTQEKIISDWDNSRLDNGVPDDDPTVSKHVAACGLNSEY
jgi:hypothetical protein